MTPEKNEMVNEYLFEKKVDYKIFDDLIDRFNSKSVVLDTKELRNPSSVLVSFSIPKNDLDSAKVLSEINSDLEAYNPVVVTCESSEYFNKGLYPLINELERKLRKLLYLAAKISENDEASEQICRLEEMDFGAIFEMLFTSEEFINEFKRKINKSKFSKLDIGNYLIDIEEITLWNNMLTKNDVPTLKSKYHQVRSCRNAVMHAHNIDIKVYTDSKKLFTTINNELDVAINNLLEITPDTSESSYKNVSKELSKALDLIEHNDSIKLSNNVLKWLASSFAYEEVNKYYEFIVNIEKLFETNKLEKINEIIKKMNFIVNENNEEIEE